ncbi:MAG: HlyC/CorC family transporter [Microbacteriaceae bacterium]|nr:HlyC/CorC family transporter [Microbacteriaceae bacterium]
MSELSGIIWLFVLLILNAFFVGAEFAVVSAKRSQIEPLAQQGKRGAKTALWAMEHTSLMLAVSQLGITVCSLLILVISEPAIHHLLQGPLLALGMNSAAVDVVSLIIAILIVTYLHVVLGEMVPKNLSFSSPETAALLLAPPLVWIGRIFRPIVWFLNEFSNLFLRIFGVKVTGEAQATFTLEQVATIVNSSTREGAISDLSGTLSATFEFTEKIARDILIPMDQIITLTEPIFPQDIEREVAKHGYSRFVVVNEAGDPIGYVHLKDVIDADAEDRANGIPSKHIRKLESVFIETDLEDALANLRRTGSHLAKVFDENGVTQGVLFLEDIIEELVGEVQDATKR